MNYTILIHQYADGTISKEDEELLFQAIAVNPALRHELQEHINLHKLAHMDMASISVPPELTAAVFQAVQSPVVKKGAFTWLQSISAFMILILGSLLLFIYLKPKNENYSLDNRANFIAPYKVISKTDVYLPEQFLITHNQTDLYKKSDSYDAESANNITKNHFTNTATIPFTPIRVKRIKKSVAYCEEIHNISQIDEGQGISEFSTNSSIENISIAMLRQEHLALNSMNLHSLMQSVSTPFYTADIPEKPLFSLQLRSIPISMYYPSPELITNNNPDVNNISLGLFYHVDENHSVGAEFGREEFGQQFTRTINGNTLEYRQKPALYCYGAAYRFSAAYGDPGILPYAQFFAGWAQNGPLIRGTTGLRYMPDQKGIGLFAGIEAAQLFYPVQGTYFRSARFSICVGADITF
jgi:hypothetical protein